jgi:hypothetical protein
MRSDRTHEAVTTGRSERSERARYAVPKQYRLARSPIDVVDQSIKQADKAVVGDRLAVIFDHSTQLPNVL